MKDYLADLSGKKFAKMFKNSYYDKNSDTVKPIEVKDLAGEMRQIKSMEIHWDKNDPVTKAALADPTSGLLPSDVEFGSWVVEQIENEMLELLVHRNREQIKNGQQVYTMDDAKEELKLKWKKGMIPAMTKSVNQMILSLDKDQLKKGMQKFKDQLSNEEYYYDEIGGKDGQRTAARSKEELIMEDLPDYFMGQLGVGNYGSQLRMQNDGISSGCYTRNYTCRQHS